MGRGREIERGAQGEDAEASAEGRGDTSDDLTFERPSSRDLRDARDACWMEGRRGYTRTSSEAILARRTGRCRRDGMRLSLRAGEGIEAMSELDRLLVFRSLRRSSHSLGSSGVRLGHPLADGEASAETLRS